jgi:hypothetical protein
MDDWHRKLRLLDEKSTQVVKQFLEGTAAVKKILDDLYKQCLFDLARMQEAEVTGERISLEELIEIYQRADQFCRHAIENEPNPVMRFQLKQKLLEDDQPYADRIVELTERMIANHPDVDNTVAIFPSAIKQ